MRYRTAFFAALMTVAHVGSASACGYHFALPSSAFDVAHPKSPVVAVAIRKATDRGLLKREAPALPTFTGSEYRRAADQLRELEKRLAAIAPRLKNGENMSFSFVFIRSRLWAHYTVEAKGTSAVVHAPPAKNGEAVVLSDESVMNAIFDNELGFETAVEQGLLVFANDREGRIFQVFRSAIGRS